MSAGSVPWGAGRRPVRRLGDRALLVECGSPEEVLRVHALVSEQPLAGQVDALPAARTVLVTFSAPVHARAAVGVLATSDAPPLPAADGEEVVLRTVYDGEDLRAVAAGTGLSVEGVVRAHTGQVWTAAFVGFAPGFAYLVGESDVLEVPRRADPRTAVPAGAVGLAGPYSAVYPRSTPGGWQLIGRTDARLWDLGRPHPALVPAGSRVRFVASRERLTLGVGQTAAAGAAAAGADPARDREAPDGRSTTPGGGLVVVRTGPLALVEDLGRPGHRDLGVSPSGALDRAAAIRANRLVGNPRGAAVVETVLGGLELLARSPQVLAVTGAPAPLTVRGAQGERAVVSGTAFVLAAGESVLLRDPPTGMRSYVAVRGGLDAVEVLGSRSTDVLSGLGPAPLRAGDRLAVLPPPAESVDPGDGPGPPGGSGASPAEVVLRTEAGPRSDWLTPASLRRLHTTVWTVGAASNRVGLRLEGELGLDRAVDAELPSEGVVAGAVQVPASGMPVVFLADHPVTGGYPVVAVVSEEDLDLLAQLRPGDRVRLADG